MSAAHFVTHRTDKKSKIKNQKSKLWNPDYYRDVFIAMPKILKLD